MALPIINCQLKIERRIGLTQNYRTVVRDGKGFINGLKEGPMMNAPWIPDESETGFDGQIATYIILTDAKEMSGNSYNPVPGDRLTVTKSGTMNGVYRQVADGTKHGLKEAKIFYSRLPCVKRTVKADNQA